MPFRSLSQLTITLWHGCDCWSWWRQSQSPIVEGLRYGGRGVGRKQWWVDSDQFLSFQVWRQTIGHQKGIQNSSWDLDRIVTTRIYWTACCSPPFVVNNVYHKAAIPPRLRPLCDSFCTNHSYNRQPWDCYTFGSYASFECDGVSPSLIGLSPPPCYLLSPPQKK